MDNQVPNHARDRKLEEIYDITMENNELLRSILKREKISNFFKILYWGFIIATALGVYYKFDDIIGYIFGNFSKIIGTGAGVSGINPSVLDLQKSLPQIQGVLDLLKSIQN
jgi:hypothetical protein